MANRMMNGSRNDSNCATRIRYTKATESSRPMPKLLNDERMPCTDPRRLTRTPSGSFVFGDDFVDRAAQLAQILAFGRHVHIDHPAQLVVVHLGGRLDWVNVATVSSWSSDRFLASRASESVSDLQRMDFGLPDIARSACSHCRFSDRPSNLGAIIPFEVSAVMTLSTTSFWVSPTRLALSRSILSRRAG